MLLIFVSFSTTAQFNKGRILVGGILDLVAQPQNQNLEAVVPTLLLKVRSFRSRLRLVILL